MSTKTERSSHPAIKILESYKKLVWPEIKRYLRDPILPPSFRIPQKYQKDTQTYWKIVKEYPKRQGKYLRPTLLLLAAEAMGQEPKIAIKTAAAMQLSEDWLLIHDDFQDHSAVRRGKPTLHRMFGPELAVNAGDTLQIIMWKMLIDNQHVMGKKKALDLANEFYTILKRTADGQAIEIMWAKSRKTDFKDEDWFFIADGKTAYYSIAGPMRLGAMIAGASTKQLNLLANFGLYLGRCFQLADDILDLTSAYKGHAQQIGSDVYESKRTIMLSHLIRNTNQKDKKRALSIIKKPVEEKTKKEVEWIIERMHHYGSIQYGKGLAKKLKEKAYEIFKNDLGFLSHQPAKDHLEILINFVLERTH
ncbi:MAG: polyprenyl synthetase family protein [Microgenomates group bacterium]